MVNRLTIIFAILCASLPLTSGCATKWSLCSESSIEPAQWFDDAKFARVRHVSSLRGFRESGTSLPNTLKRVVFGVMEESNKIIRPVAVAKGPDDRIAIADTGCQCVHLYVPSEQRYRKIHSADQTRLSSPVSAAFDDESRLYVSDSINGAIYVFNPAGDHLFSIRNAGYADLKRPTGLAYSSEKKILYAVDTLANRILAYTATGSLLFSFGEPGEKTGQFNFPTHITAAPDGRLYVIDAMNFRVQVFDTSGKFLTAFGHHGNGSGDFSMPKGIAVDKAGIIYVVDSLFDNVQLFNLKGGFLFTIGRQGTNPGEFWLPTGALLDNQDNLYVCDTYNQRVQIFQVMRTSR